MVQVGDVFVPVDGEAKDEVEVVGSPALAGDGLTLVRVRATGVTFTCASSLLLDPLRWRLVSYVGTRTTSAPDHVMPTLTRRLGDGLREIADLIDSRETKYGPAVESWERIARVAGVTTEQALGVLLAMKRERAHFSPENPDHVVDEIGYLAILAEVQRKARP